jgi:mannitol/fructose-specific phosphotransferase system IIA component (Ntr-type)
VAENIIDALDASCVRLELTGKRKPEIIGELVGALASAGRIDDAELVTAQILERESLASTGIGGGIAIPHCLSSAAKGTVLGIGRKRAGARFDAVDKRPVTLFFLMVGPPGAQHEHLRLLSKLARYLHDPSLKTELLEARSPDDVVAAFASREQNR